MECGSQPRSFSSSNQGRLKASIEYNSLMSCSARFSTSLFRLFIFQTTLLTQSLATSSSFSKACSNSPAKPTPSGAIFLSTRRDSNLTANQFAAPMARHLRTMRFSIFKGFLVMCLPTAIRLRRDNLVVIHDRLRILSGRAIGAT